MWTENEAIEWREKNSYFWAVLKYMLVSMNIIMCTCFLIKSLNIIVLLIFVLCIISQKSLYMIFMI